MTPQLKLSDFDYHLPAELIAQFPMKERDAARLLVVDRQRSSIEHRTFKDVTQYLHPGDLLVLNDTKVLPARLLGRKKTGGKVEVLLVRRKEGAAFEALLDCNHPLKLREKIVFDGGSLEAEVTAKNEITFSTQDISTIYALGKMPLPPYIKRAPDEEDVTHYQTVYAHHEGSIAAPTAGLHFTNELLAELASSGIVVGYITLHIGLGTFKPVQAEDITQHRMEKESFRIPAETVQLIDTTRAAGKRVIAVGTTSLRTLENYASDAREGETGLFIYPGYTCKVVDCLLTNFHLPRSTLYMLVCAFAGTDLIRKAYREAIEQRYRFYSYGDAMLIL